VGTGVPFDQVSVVILDVDRLVPPAGPAEFNHTGLRNALRGRSG